jgi:Tol biopolymer transport system component
VPYPTPFPTPNVTPFPTAEVPLLNDLPGSGTNTFWLYYWHDNEIWRVDNYGQGSELLVDTFVQLGQWLTAHPFPGTDCCWNGPRVVVSPRGDKLALVVVDRIQLDSMTEPYSFTIYVLDVEARTLQRLGEGVQPVWSPDGSRIAFLSKELRDLRVVDLAAMEPRQVVTTPLERNMRIGQLAWSPDGSQLAYLIDIGSFERLGVLWLVGIDTPLESRELLNQEYPIYAIAWHPNGRAILYLSEEGGIDTSIYHTVRNLWSVALAGGQKEQLTEAMVIQNYGLSPVGMVVYISGSIIYERDPNHYQRDVWLLNLENRQLLRATADAADVTAAGWCPDTSCLMLFEPGAPPALLSLTDRSVRTLAFLVDENFIVGGAK